MCPFKFIFRTDVNRANWGVNLAHLPRWVEKNRRDTKFCVLTAIFCVLPANMGNYAKDICGKDAKSCVLTLFLPGHKILCPYAIFTRTQNAVFLRYFTRTQNFVALLPYQHIFKGQAIPLKNIKIHAVQYTAHFSPVGMLPEFPVGTIHYLKVGVIKIRKP